MLLFESHLVFASLCLNFYGKVVYAFLSLQFISTYLYLYVNIFINEVCADHGLTSLNNV